jgi:hypothetical protein
MFFSPGTAVRMSKSISFRFQVQSIQTLGVLGAFGGITVFKFFTKPIVYLAILYSPVIAMYVKPFDKALSERLKVWHIVALVVLIALFQQALSVVAVGSGFSPRAEGLALWIMGVAWFFLWSFGYRNEAVFEKIRSLRIYQWRGVLLALCLILNSNFLSLIQDLRIAPLYAAEHRNRESFILEQKEKGETDIIVPLLSVKPGLLFLSDLHPIKNEVYSEVMGVNSIKALPLEVLSDKRQTEKFLNGDVEVLASIPDPTIEHIVAELYDPRCPGIDTVKKDYSEASRWYKKAAENGDNRAQRTLSGFYARAMGVPQSYPRAVCWFLRSQF